MNVRKQIDYWLTTAKSDLETAEIIFRSGRNYHHCLFFCHLVLEKGLKALVVKATKKIPPRIHSLPLLGDKAKVSLEDDQRDFLLLMNGFNIEGRYPDEQFGIYKRVTKSYAAKLLAKTREQFEWMEELARQSE
jgi:HEPN domain-containing protein